MLGTLAPFVASQRDAGVKLSKEIFASPRGWLGKDTTIPTIPYARLLDGCDDTIMDAREEIYDHLVGSDSHGIVHIQGFQPHIAGAKCAQLFWENIPTLAQTHYAIFSSTSLGACLTIHVAQAKTPVPTCLLVKERQVRHGGSRFQRR